MLVVKSPLKGWGAGWGERGRLLRVPARTRCPGNTLCGTPDPWQLPVPVPGVNWEAPLQPGAPESSSAKLLPPGSRGRRGTRCRAILPLLQGGMAAPTPSPSPQDWGPPAPLPSLPSLPTSPQEDTGSRPQHLSTSSAQRHQRGSRNGEWPCGSLQHRYLDGGSRHREHQGEEPTVSSQPQSSIAEGTLPSTPFPRLDTLHPGGAHGLGSPGAWGRGRRMEQGHPWAAAGGQPRAFPCRRRGRRRCRERGWHGAGSVPTTGWAKRGSHWPPAPRESSTDAAASSDPPARPAPSSDSRWEVAGERRERLRRRQQEGSGAG